MRFAASQKMTVFCLHYLGGSSREWARLAEAVEGSVRIVPIDLPGFGDAAHTTGYSVAEMADHVVRSILADVPDRWMIAGHSMGAKVAGVIARRAQEGAAELAGLAGLLLVAGSPPSPEPMGDEQRAKMLDWFRGDDILKRTQAHEYVSANSEAKIDAASFSIAEDDVLRCNRDAWVAWLENGSREDWSQRVGVLHVPTLVIAGADDENLGPDAQRRLTLPHYANASLVTLPDAKHLLPLECTADLAELLIEHVRAADYRDLIASARVSTKTREALASRDGEDDPAYVPATLDAIELATLRTIVDRIVPQAGASRIDLAARIDKALAANEGDGWRFAALPSDAEAYRQGLATVASLATALYAGPFSAIDVAKRDELLANIAGGKAPVTPADALTASQMRMWFEDVRADAVKAYLGHPKTLARMGYSGIANGGDGMPKSGFGRVGLGQREAWEPEAFAVRSR